MKRPGLYALAVYLGPLLLLGKQALCGPINCDADYNIVQNNDELTTLCKCKNVKGMIKITDGVSGELSLEGIETVDGALDISSNSRITKISSRSVKRLGDISLMDMESLASVHFPRLASTKRLQLVECPLLLEVDFSSLSGLWDLNILNTGLTELKLNTKIATHITIWRNRSLQRFTLQADMVPGEISIVGNAENMTVELPHLIYTRRFEYRTEELDPQAYDIANDKNEELQTLPLYFEALIGVGDVLIKLSHPMRSLEFPRLRTIEGSFEIVGDTEFVDVAVLKQVNGSFSVEGSISMLLVEEPTLFHHDVRIKATNTAFDYCLGMDDMRQKKFIDGSYSCQVEGRHSEWSDVSVSAKRRQAFQVRLFNIIIAVSAVFPVFVMSLFAIRYYIVRRHVKRTALLGQLRIAEERQPLLVPGDKIGELVSSDRMGELATERETGELSGRHGLSELIERTGELSELGHSDVHELSDTPVASSQI